MRADTDFISYIRALCTRKVRFVLEAPKLGLSELRITLPSISSIDALFDTHPRVSPHLQCSLTSALSHHVLTHDPQLLPSPSLRRSPRHHGLLRDPAHLRRGPGPGPCPRRLPRRRSGRRHGAAHPRASHPAGLLHRRRRHRFRLHRRPARRARHRLAAAQHADAAVHEQQQHFGRRRRHGRGRGRGARWLGWRRRPRGRRHRAARGAGPGRRGGPAAAGPQGREPARVPGQDGRVRADHPRRRDLPRPHRSGPSAAAPPDRLRPARRPRRPHVHQRACPVAAAPGGPCARRRRHGPRHRRPHPAGAGAAAGARDAEVRGRRGRRRVPVLAHALGHADVQLAQRGRGRGGGRRRRVVAGRHPDDGGRRGRCGCRCGEPGRWGRRRQGRRRGRARARHAARGLRRRRAGRQRRPGGADDGGLGHGRGRVRGQCAPGRVLSVSGAVLGSLETARGRRR